MRPAILANVVVLGVLSFAAGRAAPQNSAATAPASLPGSAGAARQKDSSASPYLLKAKTRLVTIDVVAMDSRGNAVDRP